MTNMDPFMCSCDRMMRACPWTLQARLSPVGYGGILRENRGGVRVLSYRWRPECFHLFRSGFRAHLPASRTPVIPGGAATVRSNGRSSLREVCRHRRHPGQLEPNLVALGHEPEGPRGIRVPPVCIRFLAPELHHGSGCIHTPRSALRMDVSLGPVLIPAPEDNVTGTDNGSAYVVSVP